MDRATRQAPQEPSPEEIILQGELFIQRAAELKEELQSALDRTDALMINLLDVTDMDLAGLQLLCAAHRAAVDLNKHLGTIGGDSEGIERVLRLGGVREGESCRERCGGKCLWKNAE